MKLPPFLMNSPPVPWLPLAGRWLVLLVLALGVGACQKAKPTAESEAATGYYTCSMHPQVHEAGPGHCPICQMDLIAVKAPSVAKPAMTAAAVYTCPMHPQVHQNKPGLCPICGMNLVKQAGPAMPTGAAKPDAADLTLTAQQMQLGNIHMLPIGRGQTATSPQVVLTGTLTADARQTASVSSRVAGRVEHLYVRQTGQLLQRGAPLFSIYSEQLQAIQQEYVVSLKQSREFGGSYQQFAEATAQKLRLLGLTTAQLRQLAARGRPNPVLTYYSPQTGTVQSLDVVQGQYVAEGSPLLTLTNLGTIWLEAQLYPNEVARLPLGTTVTVQVAGRPGTLRGRVVFLSPELSGSTQVALARIQLANTDGRLQPGAQANVLLDAATAPAKTALQVPQEAVIHDGEVSYVWKQTGERQFRRIRVTTGEGTATAVPITSGVQAGDRIVVSGAYLLQSEFSLRQGATDSMNGMTM